MRKTRKSIVTAVLLLVNIMVFANNDALKELVALCKPYAEAQNLQVKTSTQVKFRKKLGIPEVGELKRQGPNILIEQPEMLYVQNERYALKVDKQEKVIVVGEADATRADQLFAALNTGSFIIGLDSIWLDSAYTSGKRFVLEYGTEAPVAKQVFTFHEDGKIAAIELVRTEVNPNTGTTEGKIMLVEYKHVDLTTTINKREFSEKKIFKDFAKRKLRDTYQNFQIIDLLKK